MYRIRWDHILVFLVLVSTPLVLHWLRSNVNAGDFGAVPVLGEICATNPEAKSLILLAILLAGVYLFVKTLLRG
jgi:hypothetical protein